ncbi:cell division protein FtsW [Clostridium algifaecis]|uniref:Probable peptidoglycan glycosyltransferase FtsW n=1 Tax=Clostridium algifaecis TaxID=1472040 RepID=A0ABS4KN38_9CLOT|nr:stage V sporulation protein E [Clostridium algifaecis]MBP2031435.1 cell division protein FtsW [Clostridium algifaecis]
MYKLNKNMGSIDFILFSTIMLLIAIGVVMVYSASSYMAFFDKNIQDSTYYLKRQGLWAILGTIFMFAAIKFDYHKIKKYTKILMIFSVILLLIVFAFEATKGAQRWIRFGSVGFQPSEITKYIIVLYMAKSIEVKGGRKIGSFLYGVLPYLLVSGFYAGLVLAEKNLSIAAVIMIVTLIILYASGAKITHMVGVVLFVVLGGVAGIILEPYRMARFTSFLNPWADPKGKGYQLIQSLLALGSGGIWGVGLGKSRQKCYYIPEPHNDFIFSIIGEELGLIGCIIIITLFIIFIWRGIVTAIKASDTYGTILATGITSVIAVQAIINIAVVTGSMPVTGVPLPFISYGGSSLLFNMLAMGVLLNISRQSKLNNMAL